MNKLAFLFGPAVYVTLLVVPLYLPSSAAMAQEAPVGQTAQSSVGQIGQRQTRDQAAPSIEPMRRISNRLQNRIQTRIQSRIDRNQNPRATTLSPFAVADEETRTLGRPQR
ncbi:hypothetical protein [Sphingomonas dokdonensis]|uniref:hypothetical protein n=1 Tax=Sphingomonas dokdonensis TaxID=344880 RepID=UPI000B4BD601|nr:hypothetical protein [Sphingomonas dokdonensis]